MRGFLAYLVALFLGIGAAQACNNPNPNLLAPPFVDGCDVPAVALNRMIAQGAANFSATPLYGGTTSSALMMGVLGSIATPDTTQNAALIVQKITTGAQTGTSPNSAAYFSTQKTGSTAGERATGIIAEGYDNAGGNGTFVEGGRFHGTLGASATSGQADGLVCLAQNTGATAWDFLIGCEAAVENAGFDAPVSTSFNANHFAVDFLSTVQNAGSHITDAAFMVNPNNAKATRVGFFVPPGTVEVTDSAFRSAATSVYGLDLRNAVNTYSVSLPNNTPMSIVDSTGADHNIMYMPSAGVVALILGTGTQGVTFPAVSAPATPGAGFYDLYMDGADSQLKVKGPGGLVQVIGPATVSVSCAANSVTLSTFTVIAGLVTHC